jgi:hypothetical protein
MPRRDEKHLYQVWTYDIEDIPSFVDDPWKRTSPQKDGISEPKAHTQNAIESQAGGIAPHQSAKKKKAAA